MAQPPSLTEAVYNVTVNSVFPFQTRIHCQPYEPKPPKNPLLSVLEQEVITGKLTKESASSRYDVRACAALWSVCGMGGGCPVSRAAATVLSAFAHVHTFAASLHVVSQLARTSVS